MNNIDRLIIGLEQKTIKPKNYLIHSISGTHFWLTAQKIGKEEWLISLFNPTRHVVYNLGIVPKKRFLKIWKATILLEVDKKLSINKQAEIYKNMLKRLLNRKKKK